MAKKDNEDFENSTKCWICDKAILMVIVNLRNVGSVIKLFLMVVIN